MATGQIRKTDDGAFFGNIADIAYCVDFWLEAVLSDARDEHAPTHEIWTKGVHGRDVKIGSCKAIEIAKQGSPDFGKTMFTKMYFTSDALPDGSFKAYPNGEIWDISKNRPRPQNGTGSGLNFSGMGQPDSDPRNDEMPF